jgi:lantibiotic modifying enzyme
LLPDDGDVESEIDAAIETTRASLLQPNNFSLCHGHAGNADMIMLAADRLGRSELRDDAASIGNLGTEQFSETGLPWPCGVQTDWECPALMLGLAGIGHFYLRLADPKAVRSVLITLPRG